jgi:hypothetical protein
MASSFEPGDYVEILPPHPRHGKVGIVIDPQLTVEGFVLSLALVRQVQGRWDTAVPYDQLRKLTNEEREYYSGKGLAGGRYKNRTKNRKNRKNRRKSRR